MLALGPTCAETAEALAGLTRVPTVVTLASNEGPLADVANVVIPVTHVYESSGTFTNAKGIAQGFEVHDKTGNGIIYSSHIYPWKHDWQNKVLCVADKHPILVGEVGADEGTGQEDPYIWVPDMLGFIQKHKLHWTAFSFHPKATPIVITDWRYTPSPHWGAFAKRALAGEKFDMKKMR